MSKIWIVAYFTFKEILKSKVLLNVFFSGLGLMLVTYVATEFTYGVPEKVALDFGIGILSLSSMAISLFLGVTLLSKEIDSRTVYMVISRPVPRYCFIMGKILGLLGIQLVNVVLLSLMTILTVKILGGPISPLIYWCIGFTLLESVILLLVVLLVSLFANTVLSTLFSVIILILGHAVKETQNISFVKRNPIFEYLLDFYHYFLPAFYKLNLKYFLIYNVNLDTTYLFSTLIYGLSYSSFLIILIILIFNRKNLD
jgi:ABC-type transport system involved in multi-copper enzyme maturation permease subunit